MELYVAGASDWPYVPVPAARNVCRKAKADYLEKKGQFFYHIKTPFFHLGYTYLFTPRGQFARREISFRATLEKMWAIGEALHEKTKGMRACDTTERLSKLLYDLNDTKCVFPTDPEVFACINDHRIGLIVNHWGRLKNPPEGVVAALQEIQRLRDTIEFVGNEHDV